MPLTQQDYFKRADESIDQYNARIASLQASQPKPTSSPIPNAPTTQPNLPSDPAALQEIVNQAAKTVQGLTSQVQQITNPVPANTIKSVTTPNLPTPNAPSVVNSYVGGLQQNVDTARKALDDSIKQQRDQLEAQRKQYEAQIKELDSKEQNTIQNDIQPLLQPFRQNLETNERERFLVEQNYFDNQNTINEINALATGLQQDIATVQGVAAPAAIQQGKIGQIKEDALARIGVLQAVVSMRNNQISTAENFIDRTSEAILADRKDQLTYYETLLNFYEGQKDEAGKKLVDVNSQDTDFVKAQIGLLENDLKEAQSNFDNIKSMMLDSAKADILARSGVKLTDTPEQVAQKISDYNFKAEKQDLQNQMALKGYSLLAFPEQAAGKNPSSLLRIADSSGNEMVFYNPKLNPAPTVVSSGPTQTSSTAGQTYAFDTLDGIKSLPVSDLTKSVIAGYGKVKDLTPTDRAKVQTELYKVGFNPFQYVNRKLQSLIDLYGQVPSSLRGLLGGRIPFAESFDPKTAQFESAKQLLTREIARLNDVGVLSDQDVASYKAAMPSRSDANVDVVKAKIQGITAATANALTTQTTTTAKPTKADLDYVKSLGF
nr:hypothetical protein [uncultured bacterium]